MEGGGKSTSFGVHAKFPYLYDVWQIISTSLSLSVVILKLDEQFPHYRIKVGNVRKELDTVPGA